MPGWILVLKTVYKVLALWQRILNFVLGLSQATIYSGQSISIHVIFTSLANDTEGVVG